MKILKQSIAATVKVGPFLATTDGATASTALTLAQADCILFKAQGAGAQKNDSSSATHDTGGIYGVPLNTTDTGTVGHLKLLINKSSAFPVWDEWMVVPANVYDSFIANTNLLNVNVNTIAASTTASNNLATSMLTVLTGTTDNTGFTGTTSVFETSSITTAATDHYVGRVILFTAGTLANQACRITAYSLSSGRGRFTYTAVTSAPANGTAFLIV